MPVEIKIIVEESRTGSGLKEAAEDVERVGQKATEADGKVQKFLSGAGQAAAGFLAAQATGAAANFFGDLIEGAMDAEEVMAQTEAAIKSTGDASGVSADEVANLATQFQETTTFTDDMTQKGENLLLTFTNIGKNIFPETTQTMLDMSQAMKQDVSASAIQLGKALNDPKEGMTALTRVGVTFSDQQKEMIRTLQDSGDMEGAQKIILQELQREFGGSAKAAGETMGGQLRILKNELENTGEEIAAKFVPALVSVARYAKGGADGLKELTDYTEKLGRSNANIAASATSYDDYTRRVADANQLLTDSLNNPYDSLGALGDVLDVFAPKVGALAPKMETLTQSQFDYAHSLEEAGTSSQEATAQAEKLRGVFDLLDHFSEGGDAVADEVKKVSDQIVQLGAHGGLTSEQLETILVQFEQTGDVEQFHGALQQVSEIMAIDAQEAGRLSASHEDMASAMSTAIVMTDAEAAALVNLAAAGAAALDALASVETDFASSVEELEADHQEKMSDIITGGGGGGGGGRVSATKKANDEIEKLHEQTDEKLAELEQQTQDQLVEIDQESNDKIAEMDRELTEAKKVAQQELVNYIEQTNADLTASYGEDDADLIGADEKTKQKLLAREQAQAEAMKRIYESEAEAKQIAEGGDAGLAEKTLQIRQKYIKEQEKVDEEYYKKRQELANDPAALAALDKWHQEQTERIKNAENTEVGIAQQGAQQRAQAALDERQQVADEAERKKNELIAKAEQQRQQILNEAEKQKNEILEKAKDQEEGRTGAGAKGHADRKAQEEKAHQERLAKLAQHFVEEQEKRRQQLGQIYLDEVDANAKILAAHGQLTEEKKKQIAALKDKIAEEFGLEKTMSQSTFLEMQGHITDYVQNGKGSIDQLVGSLDTAATSATTLKEREAALKKQMTDETTKAFLAGQLTVDAYTKALQSIPAKVKTELEIDKKIKETTTRLSPEGQSTSSNVPSNATGNPDFEGVTTIAEDEPEVFVERATGKATLFAKPDLVNLPRGSITPVSKLPTAGSGSLANVGGSSSEPSVALTMSVAIDARGATGVNTAALQRAMEEAGYRGAQRALQEAGYRADVLTRIRR